MESNSAFELGKPCLEFLFNLSIIIIIWLEFIFSFFFSRLFAFLVVLNRKPERAHSNQEVGKSTIWSTLEALFVIRYFISILGHYKMFESTFFHSEYRAQVWCTSVYFQVQIHFSVWNSFECARVCSNRKIKRYLYHERNTKKNRPFRMSQNNKWKKYLVSLNAKSNTNNTTIRNKKWILHKNVWLEKSVHHQFHDNQFMCVCAVHMYSLCECEGEKEKWLLKCVRPLPTQCISKLDLVRNRKKMRYWTKRK